jgi:hypothetical protein
LAATDREQGKHGGDLPTDRKPATRTKCTGKVPFIDVWAEGGWDGQDGTAQPWQLALGRARSAAHTCAGADGSASGCWDGLTRRQRVPGIVL